MLQTRVSLFLLSAALYAQASAAPILGVTASSPNGSAFGNIANIVNGVGLVGGQLPTSLHSESGLATAWQAAGSGANSEINFDLGSVYALSGMAVWNTNGAFAGRGINALQVFFSLDNLTWTLITGSPSNFAQRTETGNIAAESFAWTPVTARYVRFDVGSTYNTNGAALNEVLFDGTQVVPELDGSAALAPLSLMWLGLLSLQRRRAKIG
jgi:hypothetical protein